MYYVLTDSSGVSYSYGFAPAQHGDAFGPGKVYTNDSTNYQGSAYQQSFPLSESQFQQVLAWSEISRQTGFYGDYSGLGNNCITYTFDALKAAGVNPTFTPLYHDWWPTWNKDNVSDIYFDLMRQPQFNREFRRGADWTRPRDPLVLDLGGDGIELTSSSSAVLFDHNADQIKTGSQWVKADDAFLVRDLDGNGLIDSGRELFGDQTLIQKQYGYFDPNLNNGSGGMATFTRSQTAVNGFEALRPLDKDGSGASDGQIDASDVAYASLQVWQDLNQDGISQANELRTLIKQLLFCNFVLAINQCCQTAPA